MKRRLVVLLGISALLLSVCCACAESDKKGTTQNMDVSTMKTDAYSLVLPKSVTAEEGEDGALTFLLDGKEVGGVQVVSYENAEDLDIDQIEDEAVREKFEELLALVAPKGPVGHMFSSHVTDTQDTFCLSVFPDPQEQTEEPEETMHYFFPKGDLFYDLFFQQGGIPETEEQVILDSFALAS